MSLNAPVSQADSVSCFQSIVDFQKEGVIKLSKSAPQVTILTINEGAENEDGTLTKVAKIFAFLVVLIPLSIWDFGVRLFTNITDCCTKSSADLDVERQADANAKAAEAARTLIGNQRGSTAPLQRKDSDNSEGSSGSAVMVELSPSTTPEEREAPTQEEEDAAHLPPHVAVPHSKTAVSQLPPSAKALLEKSIDPSQPATLLDVKSSGSPVVPTKDLVSNPKLDAMMADLHASNVEKGFVLRPDSASTSTAAAAMSSSAGSVTTAAASSSTTQTNTVAAPAAAPTLSRSQQKKARQAAAAALAAATAKPTVAEQKAPEAQ